MAGLRFPALTALADAVTVSLLHAKANDFSFSAAFLVEDSFASSTASLFWTAISRPIAYFFFFVVVSCTLQSKSHTMRELMFRMKNGVAHALFFKLSFAYCLANIIFLLMKTMFGGLRFNVNPWFWSAMGTSFVFVVLEGWLFFRLQKKRSILLHAVNSLVDTDDNVYIARTEDGFDVFERGKRIGGRLRFTDEAIKQGLASENGTNRTGTMLRLFKMSLPDKWIILAATVCLSIAAVASTSLPHFTGMVVDAVAIDQDSSEFRRSLIYLGSAAFVCAVFTALRGMCFTYVTARLKMRLRELLFERLLSQEIAFFDAERTGELTSRLSTDTTKVGDAIGMNVNVFLRTVVQIIGLLAFMCILSWRLTLVTFTIVPVVVAISHFYGEYVRKMGRMTQDTVAKSTSIAEEACGTMHIVRCFAAESHENARYKQSMREFYDIQRKEAHAYGGYMFLMTLLPNAITIVILVYGGHLVVHGEMSPGDLVSFLLYQSSLSDSFGNLSYVYSSLAEAFGASDKVFELIDRVPTMQYDGTIRPTRVNGLIEFQNVTFSYPTRPSVKIMDHFTLRINPGEMVALVGPSGGGKSTTVRLIERLYDPEEGMVLLDGEDVRNYEHHALHRALAIVAQEPTLYARSIKDNITYGLNEGEVNMDDIIAAAQQANAHTFISAMPEGYDTQVGEKGVQLSGGQRQRIAIARALVRNPKCLLLDEATSALDAESEAMVQQAIDRIMVGRTVLVIAHRLSTVRKANRIVVVRDGRIVEQGTHEELMATGGAYAQLVARQININEANGTEDVLA